MIIIFLNNQSQILVLVDCYKGRTVETADTRSIIIELLSRILLMLIRLLLYMTQVGFKPTSM